MPSAQKGMALANDQILQAWRGNLRRHSAEHACRMAIAATDSVLDRLEVRNLAGEGPRRLRKVDSDELEHLLEVVPARFRRRLRARSVQGALDTVLDMQEPLFQLQAQVRAR